MRLIVKDAAHEAAAKRALAKPGVALAQLDFFRAAIDRGWTRDMGPIFLVRAKDAGVLVHGTGGVRELAATSWRFNGWAKYPNWKRDDAAKDKLLAKLDVRTWQPSVDGRRVVLEGGAIDVDGEGTLLATEPTLLDPKRNPGIDRARIEALLLELLGVEKTI